MVFIDLLPMCIPSPQLCTYFTDQEVCIGHVQASQVSQGATGKREAVRAGIQNFLFVISEQLVYQKN